jgi:hypothetical protein
MQDAAGAQVRARHSEDSNKALLMQNKAVRLFFLRKGR